MSSHEPFSDVAVIGGGPAGSTVATLLQEQGWRVALFEKERHPRFHIGESLLPLNLLILERLGVLEQVKNIGVIKYGAEFSADGKQSQTIYFANAIDKQHPYAFQVRRAEFDHLLLQNSAAKGVQVHESVRVKDLDIRTDQPSLIHLIDEQNREQTWTARYVIDASGRDTLLARKFGLKCKNNKHQSAAIFGHFTQVDRRAGKDEGNIGVYWFPHGWFWMIPLRDGVMSVGAVCWPEYLKTRRCSPAEFLWQTIQLCEPVRQRMPNAQLIGEARATGNYSYRATHSYGDGYLLVGDAFAFVDPVFSTGVFFAMNSAELAAEAVNAWLHQPATAKRHFKRFDREVRRGINIVSWFIYRFTSPVMQRLFMAPRNAFHIKEAIISMLAGDLFRNTRIQKPLLMFKIIYGIASLANFSRAWIAYKRRKRNVSELFTGGTTAQDQIPTPPQQDSYVDQYRTAELERNA